MSLLCRRVSPQPWNVVIHVTRLLEELLDLLVQRGLIAFHWHNVVGPFVTDRLHGLCLAVHRVERYDRTVEIEHFEQLWNSGDLV